MVIVKSQIDNIDDTWILLRIDLILLKGKDPTLMSNNFLNWIKSNLEPNNWSWKHKGYDFYFAGRTDIFFKYEDDAMLFRLVWL
jgi:hypothetical protein